MRKLSFESADPRAHKYLVYGFGKESNVMAHMPFDSNLYEWKTKTIKIDRKHLCCYCAEDSISLGVSHYWSEFGCVCSGACDEREINAKQLELRKRFNEAKKELEQQMPQPNFRALFAAKVKMLTDGGVPRHLSDLGIVVAVEKLTGWH